MLLNDYFPLGLGYLAAALRLHGFEVMIYNADKGPEENKFTPYDNLNRIQSHQNYLLALANNTHYVWREIARVFRDFNPDIIGISAASTTYPSAIRVAGIARETIPHCKIILGGPHPTAMPAEVLSNKEVDFVVRGEGEETIVELVSMLEKAKKDFQEIDGLSFKENGAIGHNKNRKFIENLDKLPFPARDLAMFKELYLYPNNRMNTMITSRGCPYNCAFCQSRLNWGRTVRFRSIDNVLEELQSMIKIYHPDKFTFWDDSFTLNKKRVVELCRRLKKDNIVFAEGWNCETRVDILEVNLLREMRDAGCTELFIGIESGSEKILKAIRKDIAITQVLKAAQLLNKMGFIWGAFFMIGFPQETRQDIELTKKLMRKIKADRINLCVFTPYPGCELYDTVIEMGLLPSKDIDWATLSHQSPENYFSPLIPKDEFKEIVIDMARYTERLNNRPLMSLRRAYRKKGLYLRKPATFFRGLRRNLRVMLGLLDNRKQ
jgi:radical SAM superfamily enzyme YgiQ (UPF0313 family)